MLKIDMHTHIIPDNIPDFGRKFGYEGFIRLHHHKPGAARMMQGERFFREIQANCWDPALRIREYAEKGVKVQIVCTIPVMFAYFAKPEHGLEVSQFLNDHLAGIQNEYPNHYLGLGTVPMQSVTLAIQELERCKDLGFPGVQIGSNINDVNLGDEIYFPFFEACEALNMAVLVHPWNMMGQEHMGKYWLPWLVGMPAETARAAASMIFSGLFEKLPKLRVCFAHAGGSLIPTIGRLEHGFHCRPDLVAIDNPVNPRQYLGKFWVDSVTHDPELLHYIVKKIGADKISFGTDYPFPLGDLDMGKFIDEVPLSNEERQQIFFESTCTWLGISPQRWA